MTWMAWSLLVLALTLGGVVLIPPARMRCITFLIGSWSAVTLVWIASITAIAQETVQQPVFGLLAALPGFGFALDPVRGFFLLIAATVYAVSVPFILRDTHQRTQSRCRLILSFSTLLFAAMLATLLAAGVTSLIFAWEIMSLSLAALVFLGRDNQIEFRAGLRTLAFSEAGALAALAGLLLLASAADTTSLAEIGKAASDIPDGALWAGFLLTFLGFGVKTAVLPVNGWMSDAYAAAPRSLLPLFSGATLNLGVFTLWVVDGPLASHALWPALVILVTGALTALFGIMYALSTNNMTRLLTYSSIENLGIVVAALGAGFAFTTMHHPVLGGIALIAGLYHMLNHSAYKTLLFIGAGGIGEAVGHDNLNRMGGLLRRAPLFGTLFIIGIFAIAALPPSNGFASEWLVLQSLLRVVELSAVPVRIVFALSGAALALTAGLAVTCFTMFAASALLGLPRSREVASVTKMPNSVTMPMALLAIICFGLGVLATTIIPILGQLAAPLTGTDATSALAPAFFGNPIGVASGVVHDLTQLGARLGRDVLPLRGLIVMHSDAPRAGVVYAMSTALTFVVLLFLLLVVWGTVSGLRLRRQVTRNRPWNAGLVRLQPNMAYTATTFAAPVRVLFHTVFRPQVAEQEQHQGAFLTHRQRIETHRPLVERLLVNPLLTSARLVAGTLARMHHGRVTAYAAYVLVSLMAVMLLTAIQLL